MTPCDRAIPCYNRITQASEDTPDRRGPAFFLPAEARMGKETDPFYGTDAWKRARAKALRRDSYQCVWCRRAGRTITARNGMRLPVPAVLVHHIKPRKAYPELGLCLDNLVSLCADCHDKAHPEKHRAARAARGAGQEGSGAAPQTSGVRIIKL